MSFMDKIRKRISAINIPCFSDGKEPGNAPREADIHKNKNKVPDPPPPIPARKPPLTTLDWDGHLLPITVEILSLASNAAKTAHFSKLDTFALLRDAKNPNKEFDVERFIESHRRATAYWIKEGGKMRERWDTVLISPGDERRKKRLLREYERIWGEGIVLEDPGFGGACVERNKL